MSKINPEIVDFLNEKVIQYNRPSFIESDPISIPHQFSIKEDIEIIGFLVATISWGKRGMIIKNAERMVSLMGKSPHDFVMEHSEEQLASLSEFVHRTFNGIDFSFFIKSLKNIYLHHDGLEKVFESHASVYDMQIAIHEFKKVFFSIEHPLRTTKHVGDPLKGSAAKRINMYL
ncbi:MAG: DUF2400 domain-containing protein, partial [Flavobacteriales bacterium]|nr:DUF2400 domain-containing protein [Flavobacteriales bacterium]